MIKSKKNLESTLATTVKDKKKMYFWLALELTIVSLFLLALGSPLNTKLVNFLLLHPTKELIVKNDVLNSYKDKYGIEVREARFPSSTGAKLHAWYLKNPDSNNVYLVSHGNAGNLSFRYPLFSVLLKTGYSVFIYDYQGFGLSEGESNDKSIIDDGLSAYDFLTEKLNIKPKNITLYGESLGCAVATKIMEKRDVKSIILQSPFATLTETAKDKMVWTKVYPDQLFPQRHLDNIRAFQVNHPPLLLIHGENDWVLNSKYSKQIFAKAVQPKQLLMVPNLGHNNIYTETDNALVVSKIKQFNQKIM